LLLPESPAHENIPASPSAGLYRHRLLLSPRLEQRLSPLLAFKVKVTEAALPATPAGLAPQRPGLRRSPA